MSWHITLNSCSFFSQLGGVQSCHCRMKQLQQKQAQSPQLCSQMRGTASAPRLETMQQNEWKQGRKTLNTQANPTTFILITVLIPYKYHLFLPTKVNHTCGKLELLERSSLLLYHIQLTHFKGRRNTFAKQLRFVRGQCPLPKPSHSKQRSRSESCAIRSSTMVWARAHLQVTAVLDILKGAHGTVDLNARPTLHEVFFQSRNRG